MSISHRNKEEFMKSNKLWISFLLFEMISLFITSCSFEKKDNMPIILVTLSLLASGDFNHYESGENRQN